MYDLRDGLEECRDGCSESATILANAAAACLEEQKAMKVQRQKVQSPLLNKNNMSIFKQ